MDGTDGPDTAPELDRLVEQLATILFEHDPLGISFEESSGEYVPVATALLLQLDGCSSADGVHQALVRVMTDCAGGEPTNAAGMAATAAAIWELLNPQGNCV